MPNSAELKWYTIMFEPIAIIGRSCLFPGAMTPEQLWENRLAGRGHFISPPDSWKTLFSAEGFTATPHEIAQRGLLSQWLLYAAREACQSAGYPLSQLSNQRVGAIVGNLSYPTSDLIAYTEQVWLHQDFPDRFQAPDHPHHRFMSGEPVRFLGKALGLKGHCYALDAACASSLYALKLACDQLQTGQADLMIAGGINASDLNILHQGFTALKALSPTQQSRPFHQAGDGLVVAQGVGLLVLKPLKTALQDQDPVLGVIRGIGLSNDGRGRGLLVPDPAGQIRAMRAAYESSGIDPQDVAWIECHATGTPVGDAVEVESLRQLFADPAAVSLGALKAYIGHAITASGSAAILSVLSAFEHQCKPAFPYPPETLITPLKESGFNLLSSPEAWPADRPRLAAINAFGFGGNNAHLLLEDWQPHRQPAVFSRPAAETQPHEPVALVGVGVVASDVADYPSFQKTLAEKRSTLQSYSVDFYGGYTETIELSPQETRFPPFDLQTQTEGQQLVILKAAQEAYAQLNPSAIPAATGIWIGMECDPELAVQYVFADHLAHYFPEASAEWLAQAAKACPRLESSGSVLGCMSNIVANRLNVQFGFHHSSFSVSAGEQSGTVATSLGIAALQQHETDMAIVGAVGMNCNLAHRSAASALFPPALQIPGDAAVVWILKRLSDAKAAGDPILATFLGSPEAIVSSLETNLQDSPVVRQFGYSYTASALLQATANVLAPKVAFPQVIGYAADSLPTLIRQLEAGLPTEAHPTGRMRLAWVANSSADSESARLKALTWLKSSEKADPPHGLYWRAEPLEGEVSFVFPGSGVSYVGMGRQLLKAFPDLVEATATREALTFPVGFHEETLSGLTMQQELILYSFICQLYARLSQNRLGLKPTATLGYSSGESNALLALGAWRDGAALFEEITTCHLYTKLLCGEFTALGESWPVDPDKGTPWISCRLLAPVEAVKEVLAGLEKVRLTLIFTEKDCVISGSPKACQQVLAAFPGAVFHYLPHAMVVHCPEFLPIQDVWHTLHFRKTYPIEGVRFYSAGPAKVYPADPAKIAEAITRQAETTLDFPRMVHQAWDEGVRVFIEHGPRDGCTRWIKTILGDKPHLAVALDPFSGDLLTHLAKVVAQLWVAGVSVDKSLFWSNPV